jgi:antitoxin (DNA-binding transcriptional repressor) of toxin-antitoxin stability system
MHTSEPVIVGIKQLHTELKTIPNRIENGEEFIVVKNSKPVFRIVSLRVPRGEAAQKKKKKFLDLSDIQFRGGESLSQDIDKILYGA